MSRRAQMTVDVASMATPSPRLLMAISAGALALAAAVAYLLPF